MSSGAAQSGRRHGEPDAQPGSPGDARAAPLLTSHCGCCGEYPCAHESLAKVERALTRLRTEVRRWQAAAREWQAAADSWRDLTVLALAADEELRRKVSERVARLMKQEPRP